MRKYIQRNIVQSCCFLISKVECFVLCRQVEQEGEWNPFGNLFIYFERVPYFLADKCLREKSYDQTTSIIIYRPVPIRFPVSNFCYNFAIQIIVSCNGLTPINLLLLIRPMGHPILQKALKIWNYVFQCQLAFSFGNLYSRNYLTTPLHWIKSNLYFDLPIIKLGERL